MRGATAVNEAGSVLDLVRAELVKLRRLVEAIMVSGTYDDLRLVAERLIVIEVLAEDEGVYEEVREEIHELKRLIVRVSNVYRIASARTGSGKRRLHRLRW